MPSSVEDQVKQFYNNEGWVVDDAGKTNEDYYFRDHDPYHNAYKKDVGLTVATLYFKDVEKESLLIAGCGDLPESHILLAKQFRQVVCTDISWRALEIAKKKLDNHCETKEESILSISTPSDTYHAVLCSHVLYHIEKSDQEKAIRELIRVTKPGGRIVILYGNPNAPLMFIQRFLKLLGVNKLLKKDKLYYFNYPVKWWNQFEKSCDVFILPLEAIAANQARTLVRGKLLAQLFYTTVRKIEKKMPRIAVRLWSFVAIVMDVK